MKYHALFVIFEKADYKFEIVVCGTLWVNHCGCITLNLNSVELNQLVSDKATCS